MLRLTARERNVVVAMLHDADATARCRSITLAVVRRRRFHDAHRTFRSIHNRARGVMLTLMMIVAKQSSTPRKPRRTLPSAERRLRTAFPEVWAWYELLVAARGAAPGEHPANGDAPEDRRARTLAR